MNTGFIALHRKLLDSPIWQVTTVEQKVILITLLLMANHSEKKWYWQGEEFICQPGQFITSLPNIVKACGNGLTVQNVRTALKKFENMNFLTDQSTKTGRLITIVNWQVYQGKRDVDNRQPNSQLTESQQTPNRQPNSQLTESQQTPNRQPNSQLTSNNNDNNITMINNDNNNTYSAFSEKIQIALSIFEKFIRRPMHPSEIERIVKALDKYSVEEFEEACKKTKFKYGGYKLANVERILQKSTDAAEVNEKEKGFELFWELYPSKRKKPVARIAWMNMRVHSEEQYALINSAVERYKKTNQWQEENGRYIPDPDTFLQDERWTDEIKLPEAVQAADKEAQEKAEWIAKNKERWAAIPPEKRKYRLACFMGLDWEEVRDMPYVGT